jgi:hypothetical protein
MFTPPDNSFHGVLNRAYELIESQHSRLVYHDLLTEIVNELGLPIVDGKDSEGEFTVGWNVPSKSTSASLHVSIVTGIIAANRYCHDKSRPLRHRENGPAEVRYDLKTGESTRRNWFLGGHLVGEESCPELDNLVVVQSVQDD